MTSILCWSAARFASSSSTFLMKTWSRSRSARISTSVRFSWSRSLLSSVPDPAGDGHRGEEDHEQEYVPLPDPGESRPFRASCAWRPQPQVPRQSG